jgi:hypothetical protein
MGVGESWSALGPARGNKLRPKDPRILTGNFLGKPAQMLVKLRDVNCVKPNLVEFYKVPEVHTMQFGNPSGRLRGETFDLQLYSYRTGKGTGASGEEYAPGQIDRMPDGRHKPRVAKYEERRLLSPCS